MEMRMDNKESAFRAKKSSHNMTRSLIEDGSEDFTNIEEHVEEDTRISCRNVVANSLK